MVFPEKKAMNMVIELKKYQKYAPLVLRIGLSLVFLWFGISQLVNPESFLGYVPFGKKYFQWYLPLMPIATERHNLHDYDVVLSSTSSFAKGVLTRPETLHISYCHTPPRFLWTDAHEYLAELKHSRLIKSFLPRIVYKLRMWDKMSVDRVDCFIANSLTVQRRINKYYRRDSDIIHPPVETDKFKLSKEIGNYFVAGGRLVSYKKLDIVIKTFNRWKQPLKIFGIGPELKSLQKMARYNIEFLGKISDEFKADLFSKAKAFIHPQMEDFGITPLESMSAGRPVIAYAFGGATETITANETGVFFNNQSWEALLKTLINFDHSSWHGELIRARAAKFNLDNFKFNIKKYIEDRYEEFNKGFEQPVLNLKI